MFRLPDALERALADRTHGSSVLALSVARLLAHLPGEISEAHFTELARALLTRRPHFALLFHLLHATGQACFSAAGSRSPGQVQSVSAQWLSHWQSARQAIRLPVAASGRSSRVLTWSHSGTVALCLHRLVRDGTPLQACCALSLPGGEGAAMAESLATLGVASEIVADREVETILRGIGQVVVGADALHLHGFWNKVGTARLLAAAAVAGVPAYVVAESEKWCHPAWGASLTPKDAATESDSLFELIANQHVTSFVTEAGEALPGTLGDLLEPPPYYPPLAL